MRIIGCYDVKLSPFQFLNKIYGLLFRHLFKQLSTQLSASDMYYQTNNDKTNQLESRECSKFCANGIKGLTDSRYLCLQTHSLVMETVFSIHCRTVSMHACHTGIHFPFIRITVSWVFDSNTECLGKQGSDTRSIVCSQIM